MYAAVSPVLIWRFASALAPGRPPWWVRAAAVVLVLAGCVDLTENVLLIGATDSVEASRVSTAHDLEPAKVGLFLTGLALALAANYRAVKTIKASP